MRDFAILVFVVSACGGANIDPGTYKVTASVQSDTCGDAKAVNDTWILADAGTSWTITDIVAATSFPAKRNDNGSLDFTVASTTTVNNCILDEVDNGHLSPFEGGFNGPFTANVSALCNGKTCTITWAMIGTPQ